jgi:hypothetical protein
LVHPELIRVKYGSPLAEPDLSGRQLNLKVIFTDLPRTAAALAAAQSLARGLRARITLLVAQVVPYPLPLDQPDVPMEFTARLLESVAFEDTAIEIYLCRDRNETLRRVLGPDSLVVIGARKWRDWRLTSIIRRSGRRVVVVPV